MIPLLFFISFIAVSTRANGQSATSTIVSTLRAKATPDECYKGLGLNGPLPIAQPPCTAPAIPKVNQAYVWSLATANNNDVWFGTAANVVCTAQNPRNPNPQQTSAYACEFGLSPYAYQSGGFLPDIEGDWRTPYIYLYNESTGQLKDMSPTTRDRRLTATTLGFRAASVIGDLVLLAGPNINISRGINVFAFQASTKQFLGWTTISGFSDIRKFTQVNGVPYAGVANSNGTGSIIRWTGTISPPPCDSCFTYEVVGNMDNEAAYLAEHNGRLFATTWPRSRPGTPLAGLWMSPAIPTGGLRSANANSWTEVFNFGNYEPDSFLAQTYAGGPLMSFGGFLYFGTMHSPASMSAWKDQYGAPTTPEKQLADFQGTLRPVALFRGSNFDANPTIDVLYGEAKLPVYQPNTDTWTMVDNNLHKSPLYGPSGYGNPFNTYTWSMTIWNNRLWIGTLDWSYLANLSGTTPFGNPYPAGYINPANFGADLFSFANSSSAANLESQNGLGNITNYGIRNMASTNKLYFGIANSMNLLTNPSAPMGGWELIQAVPK